MYIRKCTHIHTDAFHVEVVTVVQTAIIKPLLTDYSSSPFMFPLLSLTLSTEKSPFMCYPVASRLKT